MIKTIFSGIIRSTFYTGQYGSGGYSNAEYDGLIDSLTGENDNAKRLDLFSGRADFF